MFLGEVSVSLLLGNSLLVGAGPASKTNLSSAPVSLLPLPFLLFCLFLFAPCCTFKMCASRSAGTLRCVHLRGVQVVGAVPHTYDDALRFPGKCIGEY